MRRGRLMAVDAQERVPPRAPHFGILCGMKQIVTATAAFGRMREKGVTYVDKTAYFHRLPYRVCQTGRAPL